MRNENGAHHALQSDATVTGNSKIIAMSIVDNKKAFFDYFIEDRYEAGLELQGWEVKAIRAGRAHVKEAYVRVIRQQVYLVGATISPLGSASTHITPDSTRIRRCLLHREQIDKLIGKVKERGYTLVPINLHFSKGLVKLEIGLAKGKKDHDKRATIKEREGQRDAQNAMKKASRDGGRD
jgi:SsrA-binding protein